MRKYRTSYLSSHSNFVIGWGSIFNIAGNYFLINYSKNDIETDEKAIKNDWEIIGQDISDVLKKYPKKKIHLP